MILGWRNSGRIGPESLITRARPLALFTLACLALSSAGYGLSALLGSDRANIYVWCGSFAVLMAIGMAAFLQRRLYVSAVGLLLITAGVVATALMLNGALQPEPIVIATQ